MYEPKKSFREYLTTKNIVIGLMALLLIFALLGGGYGYKFLKNKYKKDLKSKELQIIDSQHKQDSISRLVVVYKTDADYFREEADKLFYKNNLLNEEIKRKEKKLGIRDTSFARNANVITESVRGFNRKENNPR